MAISPIQIFQQQQNPLAQILAGGNDVITGIFDKAIQIGRDMSNKQLQQEQDMMAMRATETAMAQRRAENLQQNNEDAIKFARSAFESDRKFGVDQAQQGFENQRVTAQDLFSNQQSDARLGLAERGLDLQTEKFEADKAQVEQARADTLASKQQVKDSYTNLITGGQPKTLKEAVNVSGMFSDKPTQSSGYKTPQSLAEAKSLFSAAKESGDGAAISHFGKYVDSLAKNTASSTARPPDPTRQAINELTLEDKRNEADKEFGTGFVDSNPTAFVPSAGKYESELYQLATKEGVKPEDALYSKDFPEEKRKAIIEAQKVGQFGIEKAAIERIDDIEQYVRLGGLKLSDTDKEARRKLYRRLKGQTAPQAGAPRSTGNPAEDTLNSLLPP